MAILANSFNREKRVICKDMMYVDIFKVFDIKKRGKRERKYKSTPQQINLNEKKAVKRFNQLLDANFGKDDLAVHLTYAPEFLPSTIEEAEKTVRNYIRRLKYRRKKLGLPEMKYVIVSEYKTKKDGTPTRFHHHIIMDGRLKREEVENAWRMKKKKGESEGSPIGWANCKRLQPNECGLAAYAKYLTKGQTIKKRWHPSQNLAQPIEKKNDYKWSNRKVEMMAGLTDDFSEWRKIYPGYRVVEANSSFNQQNASWKIELLLRRDGANDYFVHHTGNAAKPERICQSQPKQCLQRE